MRRSASLMVIVNPKASSVTPHRVERVAEVLGRRLDVTVSETTGRGDATTLARGAADRDVDCVAVLAGDGTLNEAANGLVGTGVVLAPLPGGSTSVFARSIGLPRRATDAASVVADALATGRSRRIGLGRVTADGGPPRVFLCHLGIGWDAEVVAEVERHRNLERRATVVLYTWAGLRTFLRYGDRRRPRLVTRSGSERVSGCFTLVQNSDPYTFIGPVPLSVAPTADRQGPLTSTTLRSLTAPVLLRALASAATGRELRTGTSVDVQRGVESMTVDALGADGVVGTGDDRMVPFQVDGDHMGSASTLQIDHLEDALQVVDPLSDRTIG